MEIESKNPKKEPEKEIEVGLEEEEEVDDDEEEDQTDWIPMLTSNHSNQRRKRFEFDDQEEVLKGQKIRTDLWGFYSYSFASEIFSIVAVSLFLPITLEQFARDNGFQYPDHHLPCQASSKPIIKSFNQTIPMSTQPPVCEVHLFGRWFDTASFPLYVFSISVAIQAILVCSLGDAADHPTIRKSLLVIFAATGSLSGMSFFFLKSSSTYWYSTSFFAILSNVSLGCSLVCLNSFIPSICKNQTEVSMRKERIELEENPSESLIEEYDVILSHSISNLSAKGISIGFSAGILALFISLIPVTIREGDTTSLRWAVGSSGIWWAIFTIPAALWLPPSNWKTLNRSNQTLNPMKSWKEFGKMLKARDRLKHTFYYLMAWFLLSDAYSTITSTAIVFGKTALQMSSSHLILIGIITPATGILGALLAPYLQSKLDYFNGRNGGLKIREWEMFVLAGVFGLWILIFEFTKNLSLKQSGFQIFEFGLMYGAFQSYARSLFAELIPPGQEAKWYSLFSITDKSSSFFGPFIVGTIADLTHNIRYGFVFILIILLISLPLLNLIKMEVGKEEALRFSQEEEEKGEEEEEGSN
ncbi:autophagy-related protein 22-like protein [Melampsora americana]|nr:autophagy-related protein 22-like protein [Melampsora americana]